MITREKKKSNEDLMTDDGDGLSVHLTSTLTPKESVVRAQEEANRKILMLRHSINRLYFNSIHSWYVGTKGLSVEKAAKGLFSLKNGDYLVIMNRGVADSMYDDEVVSIVQGFHNLKEPIELDVIADVIASRAFDKIIKFDQKRPLVEKISRLDCNMKLVSVDECHCIVMQVGLI